MKPRFVVPIAALCAVLAVAGCGSSKKSSSTGAGNAPANSGASSNAAPPASTTGGAAAGGAGTVKLAADQSGQLKFDQSTLTAKAGKVTLDMANPSPVQHAIGVRGNGVDQKGAAVGQGSDSKITVTLKPGKYTFYCPVDGHEAAGMKGTLTVK